MMDAYNMCSVCEVESRNGSGCNVTEQNPIAISTFQIWHTHLLPSQSRKILKE